MGAESHRAKGTTRFMAETWRLFIAVELPEGVLQAISAVQNDLKKRLPERALRWVRPEGIHLTLQFLGDVERDRVDELADALAQAAADRRRIDLAIEGLGCFPNPRRPRVLWLGIGGEVAKLRLLQQAVEAETKPLGFQPEGRPFSPHLTLARVQRNASRSDVAEVGASIERRKTGRVADFAADGISLIRSQLKPSGAEYTQVAHVALDG
jgi:2'-5' RNA ligase